ncbi:MAG: hypothetical protein K0U72_13490 [Gammaproteobacteria bacterium]|nr:hypothetical protein [Gammaproteobacteria bacterium]
MSPDELFSVIGHPEKLEYAEPINGPATITATYYPLTEFVFSNPLKGSLQTGELILSNRLQRCSYSRDENGAFEASFPLTKERTKELFINSATPLGFIAKQLPDDYSTMSMQRDRYFPNLKMEALLSVRFSENSEGTNVYLNTESTELVWKSRDHSYAQSILMHMHCTHTLFEKNYGPAARSTESTTSDSGAIELVNYRMVSSRGASVGELVEFKIAHSAPNGSHTFSKGGSAWGVVASIEPYTPAGDVITIRLDRIQADDGKWYAIRQENGSENISWSSHDIIDVPKGLTVVYSRTHSIYRIGETVNVVVGEPLSVD